MLVPVLNSVDYDEEPMLAMSCYPGLVPGRFVLFSRCQRWLLATDDPGRGILVDGPF